MKQNVGKIDRIVRTLLAISLLAFFTETDRSLVLNWLLLAAAVMLLKTAAVGHCMLYQLLHISTHRPASTGTDINKLSS